MTKKREKEEDPERSTKHDLYDEQKLHKDNEKTKSEKMRRKKGKLLKKCG